MMVILATSEPSFWAMFVGVLSALIGAAIPTVAAIALYWHARHSEAKIAFITLIDLEIIKLMSPIQPKSDVPEWARMTGATQEFYAAFSEAFNRLRAWTLPPYREWLDGAWHRFKGLGEQDTTDWPKEVVTGLPPVFHEKDAAIKALQELRDSI